MIVQYKDLIGLRRKVVMVDGCFDPLHHGHIAYFQFAASFGLPLLCNVENDNYIREIKHRPPLLVLKKRIQVIDAIRYIKYTHTQTTTTYDVLEKLKPIKYVKGADWKYKKIPKEEALICKRNEIEIVYPDKNLDSSSDIIASFVKAFRKYKIS